MKVVVEIDEDTYKDIKKGKVYSSVRDVPQESVVAIANGKPLDDVLDEIKAEFKSKADGDDWYHTTDGLVWEEAMEIIDKHRKRESDETGD